MTGIIEEDEVGVGMVVDIILITATMGISMEGNFNNNNMQTTLLPLPRLGLMDGFKSISLINRPDFSKPTSRTSPKPTICYPSF